MTANAFQFIYIHLLFSDAESTLLTLHHWLEFDDFGYHVLRTNLPALSYC